MDYIFEKIRKSWMLTVFMILFAVCSAEGRAYIPMLSDGKSWVATYRRYYTNKEVVSTKGVFRVDNDTVIAGKTCRNIIEYSDSENKFVRKISLLEEDQKLFLLSSPATPEKPVLLFDFNINAGDTVPGLCLVNNVPEPDLNYVFAVDTIRTSDNMYRRKIIIANSLKTYHYYPKRYAVEGICAPAQTAELRDKEGNGYYCSVGTISCDVNNQRIFSNTEFNDFDNEFTLHKPIYMTDKVWEYSALYNNNGTWCGVQHSLGLGKMKSINGNFYFSIELRESRYFDDARFSTLIKTEKRNQTCYWLREDRGKLWVLTDGEKHISDVDEVDSKSLKEVLLYDFSMSEGNYYKYYPVADKYSDAPIELLAVACDPVKINISYFGLMDKEYEYPALRLSGSIDGQEIADDILFLESIGVTRNGTLGAVNLKEHDGIVDNGDMPGLQSKLTRVLINGIPFYEASYTSDIKDIAQDDFSISTDGMDIVIDSGIAPEQNVKIFTSNGIMLADIKSDGSIRWTAPEKSIYIVTAKVNAANKSFKISL